MNQERLPDFALELIMKDASEGRHSHPTDVRKLVEDCRAYRRALREIAKFGKDWSPAAAGFIVQEALGEET